MPHAVSSDGTGGDGGTGDADPQQAPDLLTRMVHAGEDRSSPVRPLTTPIFQSSVYAFDEPPIFAHPTGVAVPQPMYSREHFPNVVALEGAIAALEGAEAGYAVASGMAAISHVLLALLSQGDHVIIAEGSYCDTELLLHRVLGRFGIETSVVSRCDHIAMERAIAERTRLVFVETIANPSMSVCDIAGLADICHRHGVLLVVDNTFATPALCRPIEHAADLVVHSATKFLGGHHDLTAGIIVGRADLIAEIRPTGYLLGALLGALDAWLALRGVRTLGPRMAWISASAQRVAGFLAGHPVVHHVSYPGLATDSDADLVQTLLPNGAGGMMLIQLEGGVAATEEAIRRLKLIQFAPSLGGTVTTVCYPPIGRMGVYDPELSGGQLRLSIGLEAVDDIIRDLDQALAGLPVRSGHAHSHSDDGEMESKTS
jgi:cystathionine beta-lyase/cystathionine gamma-synthase